MVKNSSQLKNIVILVLTTLVVQTLGRYYSRAFISLGSFDSLKFILSVVVVLAVWKWLLKKGMAELGFRLPLFDAKLWLIYIATLIGVSVLIFFTTQEGSYQSYYSIYRDTSLSQEDRILRFMIFTVSSIFGWEILHRGFLFRGFSDEFQKWGIRQEFSAFVSALWVMSLETTYHFIKPDVEAWGMMVFSPFACYLTYRSKSLWPALVFHFWIEIVFIVSLTR